QRVVGRPVWRDSCLSARAKNRGRSQAGSRRPAAEVHLGRPFALSKWSSAEGDGGTWKTALPERARNSPRHQGRVPYCIRSARADGARCTVKRLCVLLPAKDEHLGISK